MVDHSFKGLYLITFIQLGASVDVEDSDGFLPVEYYEQKYMHQFHAELFENLVPTRRIDILKSNARIQDDYN